MTNLLLRLFVKDHENTSDPGVRAKIGSMSGAVGICCNVLLFGFKLLAALLSGSVSIMADALNNLSDASGSIVTLVGFRLADRPADDKHPFGHARFEYLSGLAVSVLIILIGFELAKSSLDKILHPAAVEFTWVTAVVLIASVGVKSWMFLFNRSLGNRIHSASLHATAADSRNDCIATSAVLLAAVVERLTSLRVDGWMGIAVAVFILYSGWNLARETISPLLGEDADEELRRKIVDYIASQPRVLGYHDLMVHDYGPGQRFASLHVEMDKNEDPLACHELIDDMERECLKSHNVHLVIHYDPVVTDDPELTRLREAVKSLLAIKDPRLTIHDFRMVPGEGHTNLIFDVALPLELRGQENELKEALEQALSALDGRRYYCVITFDMAPAQ